MPFGATLHLKKAWSRLLLEHHHLGPQQNAGTAVWLPFGITSAGDVFQFITSAGDSAPLVEGRPSDRSETI
jgi:hypothetical protein